jgi:hypothetical protein
LDGRTLDNHGAASLQGNLSLLLDHGAVLNNNGSFDIQSDADVVSSTPNWGSFLKSGGGTSTLGGTDESATDVSQAAEWHGTDTTSAFGGKQRKMASPNDHDTPSGRPRRGPVRMPRVCGWSLIHSATPLRLGAPALGRLADPLHRSGKTLDSRHGNNGAYVDLITAADGWRNGPANYMDQWNNYVFVKDEDHTAIYQNGELFRDSGANEMFPLSDITEFYIGSGPSSDHRSYSGLIDDFGIWNVALEEGDIQKIYDGTYFGGGVTGDFDSSGVLDAADIDDLTVQSAGGANPAAYDLNSDALVNDGDIQVWVKDLFNSWIGDANLDGEFNSSDLVTVLASGTYEADVNAVWTTGDFNGDGRANSTDLVAALADGGYELGPRAPVAAVPEPVGCLLLALGLGSMLHRRRHLTYTF